jgi:hypothetical protein
METMPRAEDNKPQLHFLHVLSPVDKGVAPPQASCTETDGQVTVAIRTAKGKAVALTFNKLGRPAGGHIRTDSPDKVDADFRMIGR